MKCPYPQLFEMHPLGPCMNFCRPWNGVAAFHGGDFGRGRWCSAGFEGARVEEASVAAASLSAANPWQSYLSHLLFFFADGLESID